LVNAKDVYQNCKRMLSISSGEVHCTVLYCVLPLY